MSDNSSKSTFWNIDRIMTLIISVAIAAVLIILIRTLRDVLLPFFVACFIAYLLEPVVSFNQRLLRTRKRVLPSLMTVIDATVICVLLVIIFAPGVIKDLEMLGKILHDVNSGKEELPPYFVSFLDFIDRNLNPVKIRHFISNMKLDALISKGTSIMEESVDVIVKTLSWLLTLVYILFILIDYPRIVNGFKLIIPFKYRTPGLQVLYDVRDSLNHYFRGQGFVALCAAVFYAIGFSVVGLPLAVPMGIVVGILYMIPYFQYVTLIPVIAISFIYSLGGTVDFFPLLGKCLLVYVCSQCVCDYLITPHVMGRELGMNPAIILLSLSVWGSLLGIIGMIIALPATALILTYYQRYISEPSPHSAPPEDG